MSDLCFFLFDSQMQACFKRGHVFTHYIPFFSPKTAKSRGFEWIKNFLSLWILERHRQTAFRTSLCQVKKTTIQMSASEACTHPHKGLNVV